jgi:hypothetical protein
MVKFIEDRAAFCVANISDLQYEEWTDVWQQPAPDWWTDFKRKIIVVGNIHDNKELAINNQQN